MRSLQSMPAAMCRMIIGGAFWVASRLFYSIEFHGLEYDIRASRTYLAISHKRDLDPVISLPTLLSHRGWRAWAGNIGFALRADAFSPGYLAHLLPYPRWFSRLSHPISLGPILRWLGAHPLEHLYIRPAEEWIHQVLQMEGDLQVGEVLSPAFIQELVTATRKPRHQIEESPLSHILSWRYHQVLQRYCGPEILTGTVRRRAEKYVLKRVKEQLSDLAAWLWNGGSLYGAPEGKLSPDGSLSPVSAAMHRLLRASPPDTNIVPIYISYDFMTVQRPRIFVDVAPAIKYAPTLQSRELDARLRQAWLQNARFTCTQLASGFLVQVSRSAVPSFTLNDLAGDIELHAKALAEADRHVDQRLLRSSDTQKLAAAFLIYVARHGLVRRTGPDTWQTCLGDRYPISTSSKAIINVPPGEVGYSRMPLVYAWNSLQEMLTVERNFMGSEQRLCV